MPQFPACACGPERNQRQYVGIRSPFDRGGPRESRIRAAPALRQRVLTPAAGAITVEASGSRDGLNSCTKFTVFSLGPRPDLFGKYSLIYHLKHYSSDTVLSLQPARSPRQAEPPGPGKAAPWPPQGPCRAILRTVCGIEPHPIRPRDPRPRPGAVVGENLCGSDISPTQTGAKIRRPPLGAPPVKIKGHLADFHLTPVATTSLIDPNAICSVPDRGGKIDRAQTHPV